MDERFRDYEVTDDGKIVSVTPKGGGPKFGIGIAERDQADAALLGYALGRWDFVLKDKTKMQAVPSIAPPVASLGKADMIGETKPYDTKSVRKNKIAWVEDAWVPNGGAELSAQLVRKVGEQCGFSIDVVDRGTNKEDMDKSLNEADLIILNNLFGFFDPQLLVILEAIKQKKYVKYEHDHRELDRPEFSKKLFNESVLNVFLSPIHFENHKKALGCGGICLPLAIDVDFYKAVDGIERVPNTAAICNVRNFKSWTKLQKYIISNPDTQFTVFTSDSMPVRGKNVRKSELVQPGTMPEVYSASQYVVHLLDGWGAGERVIFEGALCGCEIVSDERSGHISWKKDLKDVEGLREWLARAPFDFWREVGKRI